MPYARKRKRSYTRRRTRRKRTKRTYSPYFRRRRRTLRKGLFGRRSGYRKYRRAIANGGGTLDFGNKYVKNTRKYTLRWQNEGVQRIFADGDTSQPNVTFFASTSYPLTSPLYNTIINNTYGNIATNWEQMASRYQQTYVKRVKITASFKGENSNNPTHYICGIILSRTRQQVQLVGSYFFERIRKMGNCIYKRMTEDVTKPVTVTAMIDVGRALQQYDFVKRVTPCAPYTTILATSSEDKYVPCENRLYAIPFIVPLVANASASTSDMSIYYTMKIEKECVFSRPLGDYQRVLTGSLQSQYPPVGTTLAPSWRPFPIECESKNTLDAKQDERLEVLEGNDDQQDDSIQTIENQIQSLDQTVGQTIDDLNVHINTQFPQVH